MHDGVPYDLIQGRGEVTGLLKFRKLHFSNCISSAIYNGRYQITTDS